MVSIGTHDMDTVKGPFVYDALPPESIKFVPLNQVRPPIHVHDSSDVCYRESFVYIHI